VVAITSPVGLPATSRDQPAHRIGGVAAEAERAQPRFVDEGAFIQMQALRAIEWVICEAEGLTNRCIV
jgi:hypothetical protein